MKKNIIYSTLIIILLILTAQINITICVGVILLIATLYVPYIIIKLAIKESR